MKGWFTSRDGAFTLAVMALLAQLWWAFVDFQYQYASLLTSVGAVLLASLLYTALFAGWARALLGVMRGSRGALVAALIFNLLFLLVIPVGGLVAYCPSPCQELWPLMELANWLNLVLGLLATAALALQLRRKRVAAAV